LENLDDPVELIIRPSPYNTTEVLRYLIEVSTLRARVLLYVRATTPHYALGQRIMLRLLDEAGHEVLVRPIRILSAVEKELWHLNVRERALTRIYSAGWTAAQGDLSYFAGRLIAGDETILVVQFFYDDEAGRERMASDHPQLDDLFAQ